MTLISADNNFALWAVMLLMVALAFRLEKTTIGQKISGTIMVITFGAVLANFKIIPASNGVFNSINSVGVPIAIVLLLFNANLKKIFKESGPTLIAFIFGAIGTTLGTVIGVMLLPLGEFEAELAGIFSATFIGGSANFVGVANAIDFKEESIMAASIAADNVVGVSFMALLIAIPSMQFMAKKFNYDPAGTEYDDDDEIAAAEEPPFAIERAVFSLGIAFFIVVLSDIISGFIGYPPIRLLILTALTVAMATLAHEKIAKLSEAFPIGIAIMYLFLGAVGASVDIMTMIESGMLLALFAFIILSTHLIVILTLSKIFKLGLPEALVGSNACILGPPTAAAMAGAMGWKTLVTPAVLCGTFGYATANFVGVFLYGIYG
ncbi:DUF819 domain-containing protein [Pseudemcibacter aquimaris]|uniref:DUF819 family protein n=1 Tax=Pseudemcibacter aquimaris TaxID=2857064 RepID=UPI0020120010|nr:DUF819 family protein [Pseudemcibacter aquimaris]MCC3859689.1 DUF819 family protein [Pseudemcibacter aquimaris]WDU60084.1 DUF819 family protein [Pseudemcibacter aquimaris]